MASVTWPGVGSGHESSLEPSESLVGEAVSVWARETAQQARYQASLRIRWIEVDRVARLLAAALLGLPRAVRLYPTAPTFSAAGDRNDAVISACRIYLTETGFEGAPSLDQLRTALTPTLKTQHNTRGVDGNETD